LIEEFYISSDSEKSFM